VRSVAYKAPCQHNSETPVPLLCDDCKEKRRRVRDRLNRRDARARARGQEPRPFGTAVINPEDVIDLADTLDAIRDTLNDLDNADRPLTVGEQQLVYAMKHLTETLDQALASANEEIVEVNRATTQYPDDYTPDRKKAIGPSRWKLSNP
jgi:hypothetical protein